MVLIRQVPAHLFEGVADIRCKEVGEFAGDQGPFLKGVDTGYLRLPPGNLVGHQNVNRTTNLGNFDIKVPEDQIEDVVMAFVKSSQSAPPGRAA